MLTIKRAGKKPPVKKPGSRERRSDFAINAAGIGLLAVIAGAGIALRLALDPSPAAADLGIMVGTPVLTLGVMTLFPRWTAAVKLLIILGAAFAALYLRDKGFLFAFSAAAALAAPAVQKMEEWERAIVLRFGKFFRVRGPGLFLILPFADRVAKKVDLRIKVTDFSAETTLTRDSVTITVDALCFWLVWDAEKAVCEVQDYVDAVTLSSKTALRSAISRNDLSMFLEHGDVIERQIREVVDRKTTEWGITIQNIEITDIQIPEGLQDSLSRLAQMEREKKGRVLLAEAEIAIAAKLVEAAAVYDGNDTALNLKSLSILNEGLKAGNSMMLVPNSITEELKSKDLFGLQALNETRRAARRETGRADEGGEEKDGGR
jgi:regulator of protease activity HflC (stomatin/prohibitin superfamily)